jgi:hypothetical protein
MASSISLNNFLQLIIADLNNVESLDGSNTFERTVDLTDVYYENYPNQGDLPLPREFLKLQITDIELDLPVHIQVRTSPLSSSNPIQLALTLPSTLETTSKYRLGRLRFTIGRQ